MSKFLIKKNRIFGKIKVPASKSEIQRAIAAATLAKGESTLRNVSFSDDVLAAIELSKKLGAEISIYKNQLEINGNFELLANSLSASESGLSTRLFLPIATLSGKNFKFTGKGTILNRQMKGIDEILSKFGVKIETNNDFLPFNVSGKLEASQTTIDASQTSQLLSGLLMALPMVNEKSILKVTNLKSKPYIDITLEVMKQFGVTVINNYYTEFIIEQQKYTPSDVSLKGDWSGGAFWFVAAAIAGELTIEGLDINSKQADIAILKVMKLANVNYSYQDEVFYVQKSKIKAFEFDATDCPDLFPPLAVLAANANGISKIKGVSRLKNKESDRATAILTEFKKMGIKIHVEEDRLFIDGGCEILGGEFNTYDDHRMAMCGAVLGLNSSENVILNNIKCVSKSYPDFFDDIVSILKY